MRRSGVVVGALGFAAVITVVVGIALDVRARSAASSSSLAESVKATITWCGWPLGTKNGRARKDMSDCTKLSMTGSAPGCIFTAECTDVHVQLDCANAGAGWCRCDGADGRLVRYDAAFCALDPDAPSKSMHAVLDRGAKACSWTSP